MRIEGFWARAYAVGRRVELGQIAAELGGWRALERAGDGVMRAQLSPAAWRVWQRAPAVVSRFRVLRLVDPAYPERLRGLPDAPPLLFVDGDAAALEGAATAVVGTRKCSAYGRAMAQGISRVLVTGGETVVSGLAFGIDRHAHEATLGSGRTVAVLAGGLTRTSPRSHHWLRQRIVAEGGAIVSVWADDVDVTRWMFPYRNRWIAGLSDRTVVVEAPERSGALHTAVHAQALGREVWAVPGRVGDVQSAGCNSLIQDGALVVSSPAVLGRIQPDRWLEALEQGADIERVAVLAGVSIVELHQRLQRMQALGQLARLPGDRFVCTGYP